MPLIIFPSSIKDSVDLDFVIAKITIHITLPKELDSGLWFEASSAQRRRRPSKGLLGSWAASSEGTSLRGVRWVPKEEQQF